MDIKALQADLAERKTKYSLTALSDDWFMTPEEYAEICVKFWEDSHGWLVYSGTNLPFYTTDGSEWAESSDNAHDGINVEWAGHWHGYKTAEEVRTNAPEHFERFVTENIELLREEYEG